MEKSSLPAVLEVVPGGFEGVRIKAKIAVPNPVNFSSLLGHKISKGLAVIEYLPSHVHDFSVCLFQKQMTKGQADSFIYLQQIYMLQMQFWPAAEVSQNPAKS